MARKPEPPVTSTAMMVDLPIPGTDRRYTLRIPTFGDAGDLAAAAVTAVAPNDTIFTEALREALRASDLPDEAKAAHLASVDAAEEAQDALDALFTAHGADRRDWSADARREIAEAQRAFLSANRARQRAEWAMRGDAGLAQLRRHQLEAGRTEQTSLVALCLGLTPGEVHAMPAVDALTVYQRAASLLRPSAAAEKN